MKRFSHHGVAVSRCAKAVLSAVEGLTRGFRCACVFPSVETLAARSCYSVRAVHYALAELEAAGLLTRSRQRKRNGKWRATLTYLAGAAFAVFSAWLRPGGKPSAKIADQSLRDKINIGARAKSSVFALDLAALPGTEAMTVSERWALTNRKLL